MTKYIVLYNPFAGTVNDIYFHDELKKALPEDNLIYYDLTKTDESFFAALDEKDKIIVVGGDGTLNRFVNDYYPMTAGHELFYYAAGSGNDFWHDIGRKKGEGAPVPLAEYLKDLPVVTVNGETAKFLNGVGYGIDGYCCEVGDKLKAADKPVNYTSIAIKGLLFHYKPRNATVTVDGVTKKYKKVWIAPAMNGRFYGGGMMPTPAQDRLNPDRKVSVCIFYGSGKLKTLMIFPSLFKGEHIQKTKNVEILTGKEITVTFDKPCALQIDGETILGVSSYTVKSGEKI